MSRYMMGIMTYDELNEYYHQSWGEDRPTPRLPLDVSHDENGVPNIHGFYPIDTYAVLSIEDKPVAWRGFGFIGGFITVGDTYTASTHRGRGLYKMLKAYHREQHGGIEIFGTTNDEEWWLQSFVDDGFILNIEPSCEVTQAFQDYYGQKWGVRHS